MSTIELLGCRVKPKKSALRLGRGREIIEEVMTRSPVKTAVEIGTFMGVTTAFMSQFCEMVYTVDLLDGAVERMEREGWKNNFYRGTMWEKMGVESKIWFQPVKCNHSKERFLKKVDFDFAFVDGGHGYDDVRFDFELVKRCGRVLLHDYDKGKAVAQFVDDTGGFEIIDNFAYWEEK